MPTNILVNSVTSTFGHGGPYPPLSPGVGMLMMVLYAAVALAIGAVLFTRRDA